MKIVCDSCGAKYSIADEKVAGKVFKIRCKKCSAVIVVRGDQVAAEEEQSTNVYDYGGDAVWHVVVDGDQQGPFAPAQIGEMLSAGTIDWEAYVWREGFDGWLAARDVPELVEAVTGQQGQQQPQEAQPAAAAAGYGAGAAMGADPFGAAPAQADQGFGGGYEQPQDQGYGGGYDQGYAQQASGGDGGGMFGGYGESHEVASRATHDAGADLFAQSDAASSPFGGDVGGDDDVVASAPSPRVSAEQASMTGQRNENSVLFSLSNLQALATGSGGSTSAPAPVAAAPRPGHASGEGSGLIDIRALAGATAAPSGPVREERANADDLLSIGTGGLGGSLGAPVLAPVQEEKSNKGLLIGAVAAAGVLAAALVVVVVVLVTKEPEPVAQASGAPNATGAGAIAPAAGAAGSPSAEQPQAAQPAAEEQQEAAGGSEDEAEEEEEESGSSGSSSRRRTTARRGGGGGGGGGSTASAPAEEPAAPSRGGGGGGGGGGDIDSLLDRALGGGGGGATQMRAAPSGGGGGGGGGGADLPETPPRDAVAAGLRSVSGAVAACGGGQHGVANTTVTVSGSTGRVTNAQVTGQFAGTPIGSCVARAVRGARFPRFRRSTFQVSFPYRL